MINAQSAKNNHKIYINNDTIVIEDVNKEN